MATKSKQWELCKKRVLRSRGRQACGRPDMDVAPLRTRFDSKGPAFNQIFVRVCDCSLCGEGALTTER